VCVQFVWVFNRSIATVTREVVGVFIKPTACAASLTQASVHIDFDSGHASPKCRTTLPQTEKSAHYIAVWLLLFCQAQLCNRIGRWQTVASSAVVLGITAR
jgi:hypothetical protein